MFSLEMRHERKNIPSPDDGHRASLRVDDLRVGKNNWKGKPCDNDNSRKKASNVNWTGAIFKTCCVFVRAAAMREDRIGNGCKDKCQGFIVTSVSIENVAS